MDDSMRRNGINFLLREVDFELRFEANILKFQGVTRERERGSLAMQNQGAEEGSFEVVSEARKRCGTT